MQLSGEVPKGEKVYQANCHCGAMRYAIHTRPLEEQEVATCDCSICTRVSQHFPAEACGFLCLRFSKHWNHLGGGWFGGRLVPVRCQTLLFTPNLSLEG